MTRIISRAEWGADPASLPAQSMRLPATAVFVHHTVTPTSDNPAADVRTVEAVGMQRYGQFSYSYVISPHDGEIFEGCGLRRGAHTARRNSTSFGIAWCGNYDQRSPKVQQVDATRWLIAELTRQGHLRSGAPILGHRDVSATACPGAKLYAVLPLIRATGDTVMADDPAIPNIQAPARIYPGWDQNGYLRAYLIFSESTGEIHVWSDKDADGRPYARYLGRSEIIA